MKTTKTSLLNTIIVCSIVVNLAAAVGLCYIASINHSTDRMITSLDTPVVIYVPKEPASKPATTALVASAAAK